MGRVISIVPALPEVHLRRGIDTMWRSSSTRQPGRRVVCFVVLIVVAWGMFGFSAPRSRAGRFSSTYSLRRWALEWLPSGRRNHYPRDCLKRPQLQKLATHGRRQCASGVKWLLVQGQSHHTVSPTQLPLTATPATTRSKLRASLRAARGGSQSRRLLTASLPPRASHGLIRQCAACGAAGMPRDLGAVHAPGGA